MSEAKFIPPHPLNTPVLFLIFNRPDVTKKVFEAIRQAKPPRLYVAADGPRKDKEGEAEVVQKVRKLVMDNIDWNCEVKTLFREKNLGCKYAVSGAIDWFFENEEMGIILEDDCLPSQSFFWFCEELLDRYKDDLRIWHIGGHKPPYLTSDQYSYNFSRFTHIWGWASWANRWKHYDVTLFKFKKNKKLLSKYEFFSEEFENKSRIKILDKVLNGRIDTWDYQWNFTVRINNGLSIRPSVNLIGNVGFGEDATHTSTKNEEIESNVAKQISFPLNHPDFVMVYKVDDKIFGKKNLNSRFLSKVVRKLNA